MRHEEHNVGDDEVNFLKIWIESKLQNITPRYQRRQFPEAKRKNQLNTIVSNEEGQAHCWINQNAKLSLGYYEAPQTVDYTFNSLNKALFLFVISGSIMLDGQTLQARDSMGIWETDHISLVCAADTRFLLIEAPINH
ncbi:pirin-like [Hymenobacter roseosalivarius DSM 11622]|uniref:Pirin-like n=2 Tax=Hymenobacter roseosalivarius TaxID=89967 RepID=A0A1W1W080_9BACT|nr:pirin-like [Hymenobacter roseosalivarius DSM 11622]